MRIGVQMFALTVLGYQLLTTHSVHGTQDCKARLDLVVILDASLSVGLRNFKKVTAFLQSIVENLPVQQDAVRVGVIRYASDAKVISYLDDNMNKDEKMAVIQSMAYRMGSTYTHVALQLTRKSVLIPERGDRPDVPNLIIVTTDGVSKNQKLTQSEAAILKENNATKIFVIGIGKDVADGELINMASRPEMVYKLTDFSQLAEIVVKLATFSCSDMKEASISNLKVWSSSGESLTFNGGEHPLASTATSSPQTTTSLTQLSTTVPSASQSTSTTSWKSVSTSPITAQWRFGYRSSQASSRPTSGTVTQESIPPSTAVANSNTDVIFLSTLMSVTEKQNSIMHDGIVHSNVTMATQDSRIESTTAQAPLTGDAWSRDNVTRKRDTVHAKTTEVIRSRENMTAIHNTSRTIVYTGLTEVHRDISTALTRPNTITASLPSLLEHTQHDHNQSTITTSRMHTSPAITDTTSIVSNIYDLTTVESEITKTIAIESEITETAIESETVDRQTNESEIISARTREPEIIYTTTPISTLLLSKLPSYSTIDNLSNKSNVVRSTIKQSNVTKSISKYSESQTDIPITTLNARSTSLLDGYTQTPRADNLTSSVHVSKTEMSSSRSDLDSRTSTDGNNVSFVNNESTSLLNQTRRTDASTLQMSVDLTSTIPRATTMVVNRTTSAVTRSTTTLVVNRTSNAVTRSTNTVIKQSSSIVPLSTHIFITQSTLLPRTTNTFVKRTSAKLPKTTIFRENNRTQYTNSMNNNNSPTKAHRSQTESTRSTYKEVEVTHLVSQTTRVPRTTLVIEYKTLPGDSVIEIGSDYNTTTYDYQHGGDVSSRDLYIFVAGGSAAAFILTSVGTCMAILCRRRNSNEIFSGDV